MPTASLMQRAHYDESSLWLQSVHPVIPEPKLEPGECACRQERISARSPSAGGMPATDGDACCVAKWCSSYCLVLGRDVLARCSYTPVDSYVGEPL